ncbi:hypothetical protein ACLDWJ_01475 [Acinetobacter baumannii]
MQDEQNEEIDDPNPNIIEQLGRYDGYVLHHYKHRKLVFTDKALHPDVIASTVEDELTNMSLLLGCQIKLRF